MLESLNLWNYWSRFLKCLAYNLMLFSTKIVRKTLFREDMVPEGVADFPEYLS